MQRITWYGLLAIVALAAPIGGQAQAPQSPQPKIGEIAKLPGVDAREAVRLPNGRVVLYAAGDSIFAHDLASNHSTLVTRGFNGELAMSRKGDRIAFDHALDEKIEVIWSIPITSANSISSGCLPASTTWRPSSSTWPASTR